MATAPFRVSGDARRFTSSNRFENRNPLNNTLCRNGPQCRKYQEGTCNFSHDFASIAPDGLNMSKKSLSVESPAFTPRSGNVQPVKNAGLSPKAVAAAAFTPRASGSVTPAISTHSKELSGEFISQSFQPTQAFTEFVPGQSFIASAPSEPQLSGFANDPFMPSTSLHALSNSTGQINPYAQNTGGGEVTTQFFQDTTNYKYPLNYHLYTPIGPQRANLLPYQRTSADFFIPDDLREDLQRKGEEALRTFANSTLPQTVEYFHSLVALDTIPQKLTTSFGYPSSIYKATSLKDGRIYALRRLEGFKLSNAQAIRSMQAWKRVVNANIVQVHDAFTGRWFGDSSLIIVCDYHPKSQTLAEKHFALGRSARASAPVDENDLWLYIVQLASALKTIHEAGLAAQSIMASKVLLTSKGRLRLNGTAIFDIINYEQRPALRELQRNDLISLGKLILGIATRNPNAHTSLNKSLDQISKTYSDRFRTCLSQLVAPAPSQINLPSQASDYNVHSLLTNLADKIVSAMDSSLNENDEVKAILSRELENGRIARLMAKINVILERPDTVGGLPIAATSSTTPVLLNQPSQVWSETGERYVLKLFRDYVFHQVDHDGKPVLDLGHIITCLNKLDAGIDERIELITRDEQHRIVVSYKELKRGLELAWTDLNKVAARR